MKDAAKKRDHEKPSGADRDERSSTPPPNAKLKRKDYETELRKLQAELCILQDSVKATGRRVIVVFEGRDAAGKGGTIRALTERVSPRVFRLVALPAPSDREKSQMYVQHYLPHFLAAGEIVIFDRSWYNRAGVERVMAFCSEEECLKFLRKANLVRRRQDRKGARERRERSGACADHPGALTRRDALRASVGPRSADPDKGKRSSFTRGTYQRWVARSMSPL